MAVQITKRAKVDQDIERQRVAGAMLAQRVVVLATAGERQVEQLLNARLGHVQDQRLDLAIAMARGVVAVHQRGGDLSERVGEWLGQVYLYRSIGRAQRWEQLLRSTRELALDLARVARSFGVLHQIPFPVICS